MFSNLDGRGDYDIINCECCKGNANQVKCSSGPASAYPGIVKRGTRERSWIECKAMDVGDSLVDKLKSVSQSMKPEEIQTVVYSVGKDNGYEKNLRNWFKLIYQVLFGEEDGPRMGFFISFFGVQETIKLINDKIKN